MLLQNISVAGYAMVLPIAARLRVRGFGGRLKTEPEGVKLGPLTRQIMDGAELAGRDDFPSSQVWADEVEQVLEFLKAHGQFERFLPRLRAKERTPALAEAWAAYFLARHGFTILNWEPLATARHPGEFEVCLGETEPIFIEVKCPGWGSELSEEEKESGRAKAPKWVVGAAGRSFSPAASIVHAVGKALPKFEPTRVNLVVTVDDLFVPLTAISGAVMTRLLGEKLKEDEYKLVSGVLMLNPTSTGEKVTYKSRFVPGRGKALPEDVQKLLLSLNDTPILTTTAPKSNI
jgi:hypothetical protein